MSLSEIDIPSKTIPVGEKSFTVYAISVTVVSALLASYKDELTRLFLQVQTGRKDEDAVHDALGDALRNMLTDSPKFIAALIANAAGEPNMASKVEQLPLPIQLQALMDIFTLTVDSCGGLKKFIALVMEAMHMATATMNDMAAPEALQ